MNLTSNKRPPSVRVRLLSAFVLGSYLICSSAFSEGLVLCSRQNGHVSVEIAAGGRCIDSREGDRLAAALFDQESASPAGDCGVCVDTPISGACAASNVRPVGLLLGKPIPAPVILAPDIPRLIPANSFKLTLQRANPNPADPLRLQSVVLLI